MSHLCYQDPGQPVNPFVGIVEYGEVGEAAQANEGSRTPQLGVGTHRLKY